MLNNWRDHLHFSPHLFRHASPSSSKSTLCKKEKMFNTSRVSRVKHQKQRHHKSTVLHSRVFLSQRVLLEDTLQTSRLLGAAWSSCRRWAAWPAGWTDCRSPEEQKREPVWVNNTRHGCENSRFKRESCLRAPGSERNRGSFRHGKGSQVHLPVLSMTWLRGRHDHFRYRTEQNTS